MMRRFKNILAVYDDNVGADEVFTHAVSLARENNARLTLIDVSPEGQATSAELEERRKRFERLKPAIFAEGVKDVGAEVSCGTPFLEIIKQVLRERHDLVIASAEGMSSLKSVYFGSLATHLMRKCPCPVWILKPGQVNGYTRVLACVAPKPDDPGGADMNRTILELATSMADADHAELHIVHAWEVDGGDRDTIRSEITDETRKSLLSKHENIHREWVEALLVPQGDSPVERQVHLPRGTPEKAIVSLVNALEIDLIVMGTVSRSGIPGLIIGNVAETVLSAVQCGVMTVKPEGFRSPVMLEHS